MTKPKAPGERLRARSAFAGVRQNAKGLFHARLSVDGGRVTLGYWARELDAAIACDRAALWFGHEARNVPSESERLGPCDPAELRRLARVANKGAGPYASRFRGVGWTEKDETWQVRIPVDGTYQHIQGFATDEEAAMAYDRLLLGLGAATDDPRRNFPDRALEPVSLGALKQQLEVVRKSKTTSRFRGVTRAPATTGPERWLVHIKAEDYYHHLGAWTDEEAAAEAYDRAALHFFGPWAPHRNFPERFLAPASPAELCAEQSALTKATRSSRYHGVMWSEGAEAHLGRWRAIIGYEGYNHIIGAFVDEEEAALARDRVALALFGDDAQLNFPDGPLAPASLEEMRAEIRARFKETTTSQYHGVSWASYTGNWRAQITVDGVDHELGRFDDELVAARAYDRAAWSLRGGPYNFPEEADRFGPRPAAPKRRPKKRR